MTAPTGTGSRRRRAPEPSFAVVYECPECEQRYLDQRRCPDCQLFCRRIDLGGECPHCAEPVALSDLHTSQETPSPSP